MTNSAVQETTYCESLEKAINKSASALSRYFLSQTRKGEKKCCEKKHMNCCLYSTLHEKIANKLLHNDKLHVHGMELHRTS